MKRNKIIGCILWISLVFLCALILYGVAESMAEQTYELRNIVISEEFDGISVTTGSADVRVLLSESDEVHLECYEQKNIRHTVSVEENALTIKVTDARKWWERMDFTTDASRVTIYLPYREYGALEIQSSTGNIEIGKDFLFKKILTSTGTGDIKCYASVEQELVLTGATGRMLVEDLSAESIELSISIGHMSVSSVVCRETLKVTSSEGDIEVTDVLCKRFRSLGASGNLYMENVISVRSTSINRGAGNIELNGCDASGLYVQTSSGNVTGRLLSEKIFTVDTKSGKKDVPSSMTGGECNITTDTGDVQITISQNAAE